ncbi:glycosyltransferase [Microbacterium sp.]|uniref:glycosyltransferase n=1 Tax=Microbacterium sp. TaxID=51671 RepID=UPI0028A8FF11|nr:glycosyltransferase [Microbacterium sp.]
MLSVIIAAYNEENVIGACLDALLAQPEIEPHQVIVSANGCTDDTARVAAARDVRVIDREEPGKAGALNAADAVATGFPRIYLDADIIVPPGAISAILARFSGATPPLAVVPRRRMDTAGRPWLVRSYMAVSERHPAFRSGLFGRGLIALSEEGRARFGSFPSLIADDLFIDSQFTDAEKAETSEAEVIIAAPHDTRSLLNRLVRVRRGNVEMRAAAARSETGSSVRPSDRWAWLRDVVVPQPRLAVAAVPYVVLTLLASARARRMPAAASAWGQDRTTRETAE